MSFTTPRLIPIGGGGGGSGDMILAAAQDVTGEKTFVGNTLSIRNGLSANVYTFQPANLATDVILLLPLLTANDTIVTAGTQRVRAAHKTVDESINTNDVLSDDADMLVPVEINSHYLLDVEIVYESITANGGMVFGFSFPTGTTMHWNQTSASEANDTIETETQTFTPPGSRQNRLSHVKGVVNTGGTAGNVVVRWAQATSDAEALVMKLGSCIALTNTTP